MSEKECSACAACESYKAYCFTTAVRLGIDTDIARAMADSSATAWQAGYNYSMATLKENKA